MFTRNNYRRGGLEREEEIKKLMSHFIMNLGHSAFLSQLQSTTLE